MDVCIMSGIEQLTAIIYTATVATNNHMTKKKKKKKTNKWFTKQKK